MKIVFMGTPAYAVKTLDALFKAGHDIAGVFAQPDKPVGRKRVLTAPPVKTYALEKGIPVFQPEKLREPQVLETLRALAPDLIVVVAYGKILPNTILELPKYGCVNGHASLLPRHRGASPIQWSIVCGDTETGVTTMYMDAGMDTGDMIETARVTIGAEETADELFERLSEVSAQLMVSTVQKIADGTAPRTPQPEEGVSYAPILKKEMALMDFDKSAAELHNLVRGFYSWPCAYFILDDKRVKVLESRVGHPTKDTAGTVTGSDGVLEIACGDFVTLQLIKVQTEGGKPMTAAQMLNGRKIAPGTRIMKEQL